MCVSFRNVAVGGNVKITQTLDLMEMTQLSKQNYAKHDCNDKNNSLSKNGFVYTGRVQTFDFRSKMSKYYIYAKIIFKITEMEQ